jgi:hypothetical protein
VRIEFIDCKNPRAGDGLVVDLPVKHDRKPKRVPGGVVFELNESSDRMRTMVMLTDQEVREICDAPVSTVQLAQG